MPTRLASSTLVIRPSAWISRRILRSISSRLLDTRDPVLGGGGSDRNTHSAGRVHHAILLRVRRIMVRLSGKYRGLGLQILHSWPEPLSWNDALNAATMRPRAHSASA